MMHTYFTTKYRDWLQWAVLAAFAGLRTSEILRLEWSAVKWTQGVIAVSRAVARKVRISRLVPIRLVEPVEEAEGRPARAAVEPLTAWLEDFRDKTGPVIPRNWKDMEAAHCDALDRLKRALKWDQWHNNALRHSFGSNRLATVKSYAQVALEIGNSPAKVREHYNDPQPEAETLRHFAVLPPKALINIVRFKSGS